MKIDETNEYPGETVKYSESSRSKENLDQNPHSILEVNHIFKGSICSARTRAKQI